jgi:hypothetical protein
MVKLTIGMPTYNDFDGVYFTLQALRLYQDLDDTELLVVDNYGCKHTKDFVEGWAKGRYVLATDPVGTAVAKNRVVAEARGEAVLCCDSHVLFAPGVIARLKAYYQDRPTTPDLLQGPIVYDDLQTMSTHFDPVWRGQMWGIWGTDPRGLDPEGEQFEIWGQGTGVFSCRKDAWPGFHPAIRGFFGEAGYIHEKVRQRGGRCLCLPWLRWTHRFPRPAGVPYSISVLDKCRNYVIGLTELGFDLEAVRSHFSEWVSAEQFAALEAEEVALMEAQTSGASRLAAAPEESLAAGITPAEVAASAVPVSVPVEARPQVMVADAATTGRRAIVCFVEEKEHLVQQLLALYLSWLETNSPDTDLVVMGPEDVLARLPEELVKIPQQPAADDPVWGGYRYINPIAGLNGAGAAQLDGYSHLLRTDVDTFITPAWNTFYPATFTFGTSAYANNEEVRQRIQALAAEYGLTHRGLTNIHTTWYGPTAVVRRAAAFTELLTKHLLTHEFAQDAGHWPGWFRGVAVRYAGEIAVNHCAPEAQRSELLDAPSTSNESIERYPHIHCWHTNQHFSKHAFMAGKYSREDIDDRDVTIIHNYCLAVSLLSREELAPVP